MNRYLCTGTICQRVGEVYNLTNGHKLLTIRVAVLGERGLFFDVKLFDRLAEYGKDLHQGDRVVCYGRLSFTEYTNAQGLKAWRYDILADGIEHAKWLAPTKEGE